MTASDPESSRRVYVVRCPTCGGDSRFDATNPSRPFCSVRCKSVDLGAWASERFRVVGGPGGNGESASDDDGDAQADSGAPS